MTKKSGSFFWNPNYHKFPYVKFDQKSSNIHKLSQFRIMKIRNKNWESLEKTLEIPRQWLSTASWWPASQHAANHSWLLGETSRYLVKKWKFYQQKCQAICVVTWFYQRTCRNGWNRWNWRKYHYNIINDPGKNQDLHKEQRLGLEINQFIFGIWPTNMMRESRKIDYGFDQPLKDGVSKHEDRTMRGNVGLNPIHPIVLWCHQQKIG